MRLGWDQLYEGHVTTNWANTIDEIHPELPMNGTQVMTQIEKIVSTYILDTWHLRNNHIHHHAAQLNLPNYHQAVTTLYKNVFIMCYHSKTELYKEDPHWCSGTWVPMVVGDHLLMEADARKTNKYQGCVV